MVSPNPEILAERIRVLERELKDIKGDLKGQWEDIEQLPIILHRLNGIEKKLDSIDSNLSKDSGWRGFFIEFIKAAAQIMALVGAGKFIF